MPVNCRDAAQGEQMVLCRADAGKFQARCDGPRQGRRPAGRPRAGQPQRLGRSTAEPGRRDCRGDRAGGRPGAGHAVRDQGVQPAGGLPAAGCGAGAVGADPEERDRAPPGPAEKVHFHHRPGGRQGFRRRHLTREDARRQLAPGRTHRRRQLLRQPRFRAGPRSNETRHQRVPAGHGDSDAARAVVERPVQPAAGRGSPGVLGVHDNQRGRRDPARLICRDGHLLAAALDLQAGTVGAGR